MKKKYKFKSMLDRDLYISMPGGSHYRMVKPGAEFTFEGSWSTYWEDLIVDGHIALIDITDARQLADPYSFLTPEPHKPGKYRSIDDPGNYQ